MAVLATCDTNAAAGARDGAILCLIFDTGMRVGEVVDASIGDLDLINRSLHIRWWTSKGGRERTVFFGPKTAQWLTRYIRRFQPEEPIGGATNIFLSLSTKHALEGGQPLTEGAVRQMFGRRCDRASVARYHPHQGRHTYGANYLLGGADELSLQRSLGHSTLNTTRIYGQMRDDQLQQQHRYAAPLDTWGRRPGRGPTQPR